MRQLWIVAGLLGAGIWAREALAQTPTLVPTDLRFSVVLTNLHAPTAAQFLPDGRMIIIHQNGQLLVRPAGGGPLIAAGTLPVFLGHSEQGLLNVAVDPLFASTQRLYFFYSEPNSPQNDRHRVAWTTIDPVTSRVDVANLRIILRGLYGPQNHNGGGLAFGPDGYLYASVGDDGCNCVCAPGRAYNNYPNCLGNASGKVLRIDREGGIPPTNPLNVPGLMVPSCPSTVRPCAMGSSVLPDRQNPEPPRTEIYAWGFRNPWRFSFDTQTGFLWIGDVGEITYEEVNVSTVPGQHFGWPFREGAHGDPPESCPLATGLSTVAITLENCTDPAFEYPHNGGAGSVTGGIFSNHCSWPEPWHGRYWFADFGQDYMRVWTLTPDPATGRRTVVPGSLTEVLTNAGGVVHFFEGLDHAIYLTNINEGEIWRIAPAQTATCSVDAGVIDAGFDAGVATSSDAGGLDASTSTAADSAVGLDAADLDAADLDAADLDAASLDAANLDAEPGLDVEPGDQGGADQGTGEDRGLSEDRGLADAGASDGSGIDEAKGCGCSTASPPDRSELLSLFLLLLWPIARARPARGPAGPPGRGRRPGGRSPP